LALFGHGQLSEVQAAAVAAHLETCPGCRNIVAELPADSFLSRVRAARPSADALAPAPPPAGVPPELARHPKFRVVRELGRGGMGVIYLAEHRVMEKPVALKVISPAVLDNPGALARFLAEVKAAGRLDHPNIARAYDADRAGELHFLVMEFIEGQSLAHLLEKRGPLPVATACDYTRQAALGLQHASEQGMAHRDVKPHNLMLTPAGVVKVLDFGLARVRGERPASPRLTQFEAFMGTPEYVAPEQATDARCADTRSDIYSLGCTLYALLTGRPPFQEDTAMKLVLAHIAKEPRPLHDVRPDVPADLPAVVAKMLAKDPARRFQQPVDAARALAPFASADCEGEGAGAWTAPQPAQSAGAATVAGGDTSRVTGSGEEAKPVVTAPAGSLFSDLGEAPAPTPNATKPEKRRQAPRLAAAAWWRRPVVLGGVGVAVLLLTLAGLWAAGVFQVKTKDGAAVPEGELLSGPLQPAAQGSPAESPEARPDGFVPLFNGTDLTGWSVERDDPKSWDVEDGVLVAHGSTWTRLNYLISDRDYGDFVLRLDFNLDDHAGSGVVLRAVPGEMLPHPYGGRLLEHPVFRLEDQPARSEVTGTLHWVLDATHVPPQRRAELSPPGSWNTLEMEVKGRSLRASVNGKPVNDAALAEGVRFKDGTVPTLNRPKGRIGLLKHHGTARFRNIEIKELPPD
jgi:hypothetical protein